MIWVNGRVLSDSALTISLADRVFEHGLGLFETFRTWNGRPRLLARHLARLRRSAAALGIPLDPKALPSLDAVAALIRAERISESEDALLRIVLTGGLTRKAGSTLWMRAEPLRPAPPSRNGAALSLAFFEVAWHDPLARHKTLNYWSRRLAYEHALFEGADEALLRTPDGRVWEGSRSNLFLVEGGLVVTPALDGPLVPGVMRGVVIEQARQMGLEILEGELTADRLESASEVFLTNAVRGIVPVGRTPGQRSLRAPGLLTKRLTAEVIQWLEGEP
jgi:branched-subunit amino acid aminotransferase/4-amino-4-deoxychorismate lyase